MAKFPIIGGFNELDYKQSGSETSINIMAQKSGGKSDYRLRATPGLRKFVEFPTYGCRGAWEAQERAFVVYGNSLYEVFTDATYKSIGTLSTSEGVVKIDDNGTQLILVDGVGGYVYDLQDSSFQQIMNPAFYPTNSVTVADGYAIFVREGTQEFFHSEAFDALKYDATDFARAYSNPDRLLTTILDSSGVVMLGAKSVEFYWNSGDANQVFQRRTGQAISYGCVARYSVAHVDDGIIWVGRDADGVGCVYRLAGALPRVVSTPAINSALQKLPLLSKATAYSYQLEGQAFYLLDVPGSNTTYVLDLSTGLWHERRSYSDLGEWGRFKGQFHVAAFSKNFVGDYENNKLYVLDNGYFKDDEKFVRRERAFRAVYDEDTLALYSFNSLEFDMVVGLGRENSPLEPYMELYVSNDGGVTFGSARQKPLGKIGEFQKKVKFNRLGTSDNRVFKIAYGFPTEFIINGAVIRVEK